MADDLFKQGSHEHVSTTSGPGTAWVVTNHLNLYYMVGAGLLMPPAGFGSKYYQDTLSASPGSIPLFLDKKVPAEALALSTSEAAHLLPVILELDLVGYPLPRTQGNAPWLWLPAPVSTTRIKRILFASDADKGVVEVGAKDYGNVVLADFARRVVKTAFTKTTTAHWPPSEAPAEREVPLQASFATGAVAALLLHLGNRGALSMRACCAAFDPASATSVTETPLRALSTWARTGVALPRSAVDSDERQPEPYEILFWGIVDRLVEWRSERSSLTPQDVVLSYLEAAIERLDQRATAGAKKLLDTLVSLTGLGAATLSELFSRHQTALARSMVLFFLRESPTELLEFEHNELTEIDRLAAAILFGVRDGWLGVPTELRTVAGLGAAVADRMASLSHRMAGTGLDFGVLSPRPKPLRELFEAQHKWSTEQDRVAQELVRELRWDCAKTLVEFGHGSYSVVVDRSGLRIETPTEPKITKIVDESRFFDLLATEVIKPTVEDRIRKRFATPVPRR